MHGEVGRSSGVLVFVISRKLDDRFHRDFPVFWRTPTQLKERRIISTQFCLIAEKQEHAKPVCVILVLIFIALLLSSISVFLKISLTKFANFRVFVPVGEIPDRHPHPTLRKFPDHRIFSSVAFVLRKNTAF